MTFKEEMKERTEVIEKLLVKYLPKAEGYQSQIMEAMEYSVMAGGKRLRPMLMQETYRLFGGEGKEIEPFMAAMEMIHTYSLVHDDLPAMDNDEYRRGRKTTHIVYGEAMGILAGDALLNYAFETAVKAFEIAPEKSLLIGKALKILAEKAGIYGMIGGQVVDVASCGVGLDEGMLNFIYELKTGALIESSMMIGALLAGAEDAELEKVQKIASDVGIAFQIQDDILDVTSTTEELGKPVHSDEKNEKTTYVTLKGLEKATRDVEVISQEALELLSGLDRENAYLTQLIRELIHRKKISGVDEVYLEQIHEANDIKKLNERELAGLAEEIRTFLVEKISKTGGHLASNLGVVELTMAMHLSFQLPEDKMIWDVGHQSYTHKILTGRKEGFDGLRKYGGMSGFPKRKESDCDAFDTGHSSTSISAGLGYARGRDILGQDYSVISVIGDGSLTGGMAYEALNNAAEMKTNFIIVLNDNHMSISKNVGGMSSYLGELRTAQAYTDLKDTVENVLGSIPFGGEKMVRHIKRTKSSIKQLLVPGMFFEDMGIKYLGPVDGHDLKALRRAFTEAKRVKGPVLVHVLTKKGKGYLPAEENPSRFHGTGPFDIQTGEPISKSGKDSCTDVFSKVMLDLAKKDDRLVAITAAMEDGTGLAAFHRYYPDRFFDVGIAEGHGVTFAAGLAAAGLHPVFAVYSSFLQRGFDQMIHDVCLQKLPVVFAVDRAGLVGSDGETHQGIFDLSYLSMIPNMTVLSPKNKWELADMVRFAVRLGAPAAVRYPRGSAFDGFREYRAPIEYGKSEPVYEEEDIAIISVGHMFEQAVQVRKRLKEIGYNCTLINARFVKPVDEEMLRKLTVEHRLIVTLEENIRRGGFGEFVTAYLAGLETDAEVLNLALPDDYIEHGSVDLLRSEVMLDIESCVARIITAYIAEESRRD